MIPFTRITVSNVPSSTSSTSYPTPSYSTRIVRPPSRGPRVRMSLPSHPQSVERASTSTAISTAHTRENASHSHAVGTASIPPPRPGPVACPLAPESPVRPAATSHPYTPTRPRWSHPQPVPSLRGTDPSPQRGLDAFASAHPSGCPVRSSRSAPSGAVLHLVRARGRTHAPHPVCALVPR